MTAPGWGTTAAWLYPEGGPAHNLGPPPSPEAPRRRRASIDNNPGTGMRLAPGGALLTLALLACGTEPDYPPFNGPAPTVSDFTIASDVATAILRDPQGAITIGRTDYTYVYFYKEGSNESQVSFAREWTWTRS